MNCPSAQSLWRIRDLLPAISLLLLGLGALCYATLLPSGADNNFAVLMNPWADVSEVITLVNKTDAQIISFNERMNVLMVHSVHDDAISALYDAGAWLVFEPSRLSSCFDLKVPEA